MMTAHRRRVRKSVISIEERMDVRMKKVNRIFAILMTVILVVGMIGVPVYAEETPYEATDTYVLNFSNQDIEGYEDWDNKRLWASPYKTDITVHNPKTDKDERWGAPASVLNMINMGKVGTVEGATTPYASIPVYCVDGFSDGKPGHSYRRVNLEDSGYFSDTTAGRLRNIILNSYPNINEAELTRRVNEWNAANGGKYDEVVSLTYAEMISASQSVIWTLTNDGYLHLDSFYYKYEPNKYPDDEIVYKESNDFLPNAVDDETPGSTANNLTAVAAYLNALAPMAPQDTVISDAAFGETTLAYEADENGTYTATVTTTVTANVDAGDALKLTAVLGGKASETAVMDGTNTYTFTFEGMTATETATVNIDGTQDASDVFLFDPANGRFESQSMAGYDSSALPVHAEASVAPRVLNLNKIGKVTTVVKDEDGNVVKNEDGTDKTETKDVPLANIQFEIYFVGTMEDYVSGKLTLADAPQVTEAELAKYATAENLVTTVTTGEDGKASYNFTVNEQPDGIYIVKELHNPQTVAPMDPFYISVPMTNADGTVTTTLNISPKNEVREEEVEIEKDVTDIDNEHDTYDVGEHHTWIIQSSIPEGLANGLLYEVTDTLDTRLTLVSIDRVAIATDTGTFGDSEGASYIEDEDETPAYGEMIVLVKDEHYTVTISKTEKDEDHFKVALTEEGRKYVGEKVGTAYADSEIRIYFTAYINTTALMDEEIPNDAHVDYTNSVGMEYDADSDVPDVITGAAQFLKVDASDKNKVLAGATFVVYRPAAEGETENVEYITVDDNEIAVVKVSFYDNPALTGDKVWEVVSDEFGMGYIYGLAYGDYYLVETEAPDGYNILTEPVKITITKGTAEETVEVTIYNSSLFELPETGGIGTAIFTFGGAGVIGAAALLLLGGKKKRA